MTLRGSRPVQNAHSQLRRTNIVIGVLLAMRVSRQEVKYFSAAEQAGTTSNILLTLYKKCAIMER